MPILDSDILYTIAKEVGSFRGPENVTALLRLSLTNRALRDACLPVLFSEVHWPHANKHDDESGLHFFPATLWPYFRSVSRSFNLENILTRPLQ